MDSIAKLAKWVMYFCLAGWGVTFLLMMRLPDPSQIEPALLQEPIQQTIEPQNFTIDYQNQKNSLSALAVYDIRGLVVSHNDPSVWYKFDITHDEKSLNTRDLCIIWGDNLKTDDYKQVSVHNDDAFCLYDYGPEVQHFYPNKLANNHLVTDKQFIRDTIHNITVGDQVHIRGKLVNYAEERWGGNWRRTSMSREDGGDGACEIIFVESIRVIKSYNSLWKRLHDAFWIGAMIALGLRVLLFVARPIPRHKAGRKRLTPFQSS